jgi:hypothetical protein
MVNASKVHPMASGKETVARFPAPRHPAAAARGLAGRRRQ